MELLQLRYFFETAKSQNIAKTAENHWVPASSVSASIKRLEEELSCKLFDRQSNKIVLNANGKKLQRALSLVFEELDGAIKELTEKPEEQTEIKLLVKSLRSSLTNAIIKYRKLCPEITFKTFYGVENEYDKFDVIIDEYSQALAGYDKIELVSKPIYIRAHKEHPLLNKPIKMIDLRHQEFVTMGEHTNLHKILIRACRNAGFSPNIVLETNDTNCYHKSLISGTGLTLSRFSGESENSNSLNVIDFNERQTIYAFFKRSKISPTVLKFLDFIKENIQ